MAKNILYIFNPEHDLALADGKVNYIAPALVRQMATELASLPIWYAEEGSGVLASSVYTINYLNCAQTLFHLPICLVAEPELITNDYSDIHPWGWNFALRRRLSSGGINADQLPTDEMLEKLRFYSHRAHAVELLPHLQLGEFFCGESFYFTHPAKWQRFVEEHTVSLLKAPLSGSGKGLNWCKGVFTPSISGWCKRIGNVQGGVVGEPMYDKVEDFAMEFRSVGDGRVRFVGYSLFYTRKNGAYEGNLLASDAVIERRLSTYVPIEELRRLRNVLEDKLSLLVGTFYIGYLGVDMMICRFSEQPVYRIHPCVEINLRMNMGVVARLLYDHHIHPSSIGYFRMTYHSSVGEAWREHERLSETFPLCMENKRVRSGYFPLIPVTRRSRYRLWMEVDATAARLRSHFHIGRQL